MESRSIRVGACSSCGRLTANEVGGLFLCPACCEMHGASFVAGAKAAERALCYYRLAKLRVTRLLKSFWW